MITDYQVFDLINEELTRAREKFPKQNVWLTLSALTEEVGELNQACLQFNFEPHKNKTEDDILTEAIQVAVMAIRVLQDCNHEDKTGYA